MNVARKLSIQESSVQIMSVAELSEIRPWLFAHATGSYRFLKPQFHRIPAFWATEVENAATAPEAKIFYCGEANDPIALLVFAPLPWESNFFSAKSGAVKHLVLTKGATLKDCVRLMTAAVEHAKSANYKFLSSRTYASEMDLIHALEFTGFYLTDTLLDYVWDQSSAKAPKEVADYIIRRGEPADKDKTIAMAAETFPNHFGRFQSDPNIKETDAARFYPTWIEAAYKGFADHIFVAENKHTKDIVGCTLWKQPSKLASEHGLSLGHYSLGGVSPKHAGKGIFQQLTLAGLSAFPTDSVTMVEGPTHLMNRPVQSAYTRMGFRNVDARYGFHLWLK